MEETRSKRTDSNREKSKKKNVQEKKTKSDTTAYSSCSSVTDLSLESFMVVGRGCNYVKSKQNEFRLHECYSETAINNPHSDHTKNFKDVVQGERLQAVPSNSSFTSAKSDFSDAYQKQIHDLEENLKDDLVIHCIKKQLGGKEFAGYKSISTETDVTLTGCEESKSKLKELERKISSKERKIKDLSHKLEECSRAREAQVQENRGLSHKVGLLNRQLQSMFELVGKKNWNSNESVEAKNKAKTAELEALVASHSEEMKQLSKTVEILSYKLESKEKEINLKARELVEYKNKSTLEMCKLINQIDNLQKEAKNQSEILDLKISEAQLSMEDEIVNVTTKLEEQYQKDIQSAIEKFHADFTRLADLPRTAIEQLLQLCEPGKVDFISYQKEWDRQQSALEAKIESMQADHNRNVTHLKDAYESKILFLKTQVEALSAQLKERKEIIDVFESELMVYKSKSSMNLLKASTLGDDISALKELYTAEIFSQKQIHKLHVNIFEEKVKSLTEEILYLAKKEEIRRQELDNAKKMAFAFREKYEQLVLDWEQKVGREFKVSSADTQVTQEFDSMVGEFMGLIQLLKKTEEAHEEKIKILAAQNENEKVTLLQDLEDFRTKLESMREFQKIQENLDATIHDLIKAVGRNYTEAVETLIRSHVTELSYKQMEMCASEKRHIEEIDELKNDHEREVEDLRNRVEFLESTKNVIESELTELTRSKSMENQDEVEELKKEADEITMKYLKAEGIIAVKEEMEQALNDRIKELEEALRLKEEICRKELESLTAECLQMKVISAAKDDITKEMEEKLHGYEALLEKSSNEMDRLTEICSSMTKIEALHLDNQDSSVAEDQFKEMKEVAGSLKTKLAETFDQLELLKEGNSMQAEEDIKMNLKLATERIAALEEERNQIMNENKEMKREICSLVESVGRKEKALAEIEPKMEELSTFSGMKEKLEMLETERDEILRREDLAIQEKEKMLEKNAALEATLKELNQRSDVGTSSEKDWDENEMVSISLQEIRFLYEEEIEGETMVSSIGCQADFDYETDGENEISRERETQSVSYFHEGIFTQFKSIQKELSDVIQERDELMSSIEKLEKENENLRKELENLREENHWIRARCDAFVLTLSEREAESSHSSGMSEVNKEIGKLSSYVKSLNEKLDMMKASNDLLLSESQEHFKHNQNLVSELEEAWTQRYEIEDQLAKVRRENALLNLHRKQLEETNKRISNLVTEGKPSVVSWIRIHETVENIVEEVLSLKTSMNDPDSPPGTSPETETPRTNSELKLVAGNLHAQLKNKTMLCDELILQKETLERELKNLENLLKTSGRECRVQDEQYRPRKRHLELQNRQPATCSVEKRQTLDCDGSIQAHEETETWERCVILPNRLKLHLEEQGEVQFRENLDEELKMRKPEESPTKENVPLDDDEECLKTIELRYEEEVVELTKEFEREVERLKGKFGSEKDDEHEKNYAKEIDKLKNYFQKKWEDLEKRYIEIYSRRQRSKVDSTAELNEIVEQFLEILREEENEEKKKLRIVNFLRDKNILNRQADEVKLLQQRYEEAVAMLKSQHDSEVRQLQTVVLQLKENIMMALNKEGDEDKENVIEDIRAEYQEKLEEEKKRMNDLLEEMKQKHEKEVADLEEFWTEKLSECETRCALVKATGGRKPKSQQETRAPGSQSETDKTKIEQSVTESTRENQIVKYREDIQNHGVKETSPQYSLCVSCLANQSFLERMELRTDDDKLDVIQQREKLEEMILSMRNIVSKLLTFIGQFRPDLSTAALGIDETLYKSVYDLDKTVVDGSESSHGALMALELSTIFEEIKDNSLLNSSDQVRFELERCLKQLKHDATSILALSCPENNVRNLGELVKRVEREKNELEAKVLRVEEVQNEMKKEICTTRERLSQWERNLEVVSEGYGEEILEPKHIIPLPDLKEKLKLFLDSPQDLNLVEEICKEGDRLQEEWLKEKCDLQQQIDVADKQLHSLKKFLEEQALEREQEREAFDREINNLQENLKAKERDNSLQNRTNREVGQLSVMSLADVSVEALASQVKDLTTRLTETEKNKSAVEGEFQNAVKKIWSLREVIQDLEMQLAEVSERENNLKKKMEKMESLLQEQSKANRSFREELETCRNQNELKYSEHIKCLEEELMGLRHVADQVNPESLNQLKTSLRQIEAILMKKTKDLEQLHVSSANVSCSSPSEDVSIRDHLDATRCSTPDEMYSSGKPLDAILPMEEIDRVHEKLARHTRAEEVAMKYIQDLKMQLRNHRKAFEEVQTERDVLLEKVDVYLKENSSLKVRLEEQRCNAGLLQKQLNANLESQISRLEIDVDKLNEMCHEKDKQLREMKTLLENTTKTLKVKETEAANKSREVNTLITTLKTDLANALNENEKLEGKLESTMEKLRDTMKMPALIESMLEEKNAEIDRLEKEVSRLSSEKTTSGVVSRSCSSEERHKRRIRFSEPESFSENISSISVQCPSDLRNCSESFGDFKNSFKGKRPFGCSTKLDSISSIAPLQLSPRGGNSFNWKASSPIVANELANSTPSKTSPTNADLQQMEEISKLQESADAKQREISELHLEIDILKRQLVEVNQEVSTAKSRSKELQNELSARDAEIEKLKNVEKSLLAAMESLKAKHAEEVEELENKLSFECGKVKKIYGEISALEEKKVEIEDAFHSLKEDYNEKINGEKRTTEALFQRVEALEARNEESELKAASLEKELENVIRESEKTIQTLTEEIEDLKKENEKNRFISSLKEDAETQVDGEVCVCQNALTIEIPQTEGCGPPFRGNLEELKAEFEKLAAVLVERDFNKREAFTYAMSVRKLLFVLLGRFDDLSKEVEAHMKKVMECSVDDLAVKVQRELVLSEKLDNQLLSSIRANGFASKEATPQPDLIEFEGTSYTEKGQGDSQFVVPKPPENSDLDKEIKQKLEEKISEQRKIIRLLEEKLEREKERILEEKERCVEDAKIMELLRVNMEKALRDLKMKERDLKKEKQQKMSIEKELESWRKQGIKEWESKRILELTSQVETQREKLVSLGKSLEEEKKKTQEARLALEECQIERLSEKNAQRLMESDLALAREQRENYKVELLNARKLLHTRNVEVGLLKRKINLLEIDVKALRLGGGYYPQNTSETSSLAGGFPDFRFKADSSPPLLCKMNKLNSCVQRHLRESTEMEEVLLHLGQETEQMKDIIRMLEENCEAKLGDETLVSEVEVEKKLWALEKEKLIMDLEMLRRENEALRRDLVVTCKSEDALRDENSKLKKEFISQKVVSPTDATPQQFRTERNFLQERVTQLTHKYLRIESHRKALAWQKLYLLKKQRPDDSIGRRTGKRKKSARKRGAGRFKIVAIAIVAIFRMRYIMRRWQPGAFHINFPTLEDPVLEPKIIHNPSVLNIYNEPVNPLSYQTQNLFRQPSSQVLRTPPSRDPGLGVSDATTIASGDTLIH